MNNSPIFIALERDFNGEVAYPFWRNFVAELKNRLCESSFQCQAYFVEECESLPLFKHARYIYITKFELESPHYLQFIEQRGRSNTYKLRIDHIAYDPTKLFKKMIAPAGIRAVPKEIYKSTEAIFRIAKELTKKGILISS